MIIIKMLLAVLFLPGNIVLKMIGVTVAEDSGIVRSFINSIFWGTLILLVVLNYL